MPGTYSQTIAVCVVFRIKDGECEHGNPSTSLIDHALSQTNFFQLKSTEFDHFIMQT